MQSEIDIKFLSYGLISCLVSLFLTLKLIPLIKSFALKNNIIDIPNNRKQKKSITIRIGGLGIIFPYLLSIFIIVMINIFFNFFSIDYKFISIFLLSSLAFFSLGFIDDLKNLSPLMRLVTQFLIASLIWLNGIKINYLNFPFINNEIQILLPTGISLLITIFWIVGIVNSINWLDGIDGLAIGIIIICNFTFLLFILAKANCTLFILICSLLGASIAFLRFNSFPSKILMGDGGSYFLGINIALFSLTIFNSSNHNIYSEVLFYDLMTPFLILALPILDSIRVCLDRIRNGYSPFFPDRSHIHHKLIKFGFSEESTLNIILIISFIFSLSALIINNADIKSIIIILLTQITLKKIITFKRGKI